ncbi:MAG: S41 family peptidase [Candidatus Thermoplasmatota archaeon]|nr:S41 family peptidase [Candidatus Thermoplasmatota archaeon]
MAAVAGRSPDNNFNLYAAPQSCVRRGADFMKTLPAGVKSVPLVMLVNEGTAAGSEIVAGALQDYKRAVIVGTRIFGGASIQTVFPVANGAALKLTTARWVTPNKRSVQNTGLAPDVVSQARAIDRVGSGPRGQPRAFFIVRKTGALRLN